MFCQSVCVRVCWCALYAWPVLISEHLLSSHSPPCLAKFHDGFVPDILERRMEYGYQSDD